VGRLALADGRAALPLQIVESAPGRTMFAKPARAFPAPIVYWRDGARPAGTDRENGLGPRRRARLASRAGHRCRPLSALAT